MQRTYLWEGVDSAGRAVRGEQAAPTPRHVHARLRRRGVTAKRLRRKPRGAALGRRVKTRDITLFSRQLATLTRAGVHLVQALQIVATNTRNTHFGAVIETVRGELAAGASLATALAAHPRQFDGMYRHLVYMGEQSGTLDVMLDRIAAYQERSEATRRKVRKALTYPVVVLLAALTVTALLLIHIVPQFEAVFATADAELPALTRFVMGASDQLRDWWLAAVLGAAGGAAAFVALRRRSERLRNATDAALLRTPIVGAIVVKAAVARCSRTLSTAASAGVPLVDALGAVAGSPKTPRWQTPFAAPASRSPPDDRCPPGCATAPSSPKCSSRWWLWAKNPAISTKCWASAPGSTRPRWRTPWTTSRP